MTIDVCPEPALSAVLTNEKIVLWQLSCKTSYRGLLEPVLYLFIL